MPFHNKIKSFVNKVKEKQEERSYMQKEKTAKAKGFSSFHVYETQTAIARKEGYDEAQTELRQSELTRVKEEERKDALDTRPARVKKVEKGVKSFQKALGYYNETMGALKGISGSPKEFNKGSNTKQSYASGYGPYQPRQQKPQTLAEMFGMQKPKQNRKKKTKKTKHKKQSKQTKPNDIYDWIRRQ